MQNKFPSNSVDKQNKNGKKTKQNFKIITNNSNKHFRKQRKFVYQLKQLQQTTTTITN